MTRPIPELDVYKERLKECTQIKLQLPLVEDMASFVQGFPEWMKYKPFTTLFKAGQVERGSRYLEKEIDICKWHLKPHGKDDYLARLGFTRDDIGDPEDKERRKRAKK